MKRGTSELRAIKAEWDSMVRALVRALGLERYIIAILDWLNERLLRTRWGQRVAAEERERTDRDASTSLRP